MDFKQLEAYVKTVELNSFSKAAEVLFVSQPSVSQYVGALEKELDTQLLTRRSKTVRPTKTGKMFYDYAKNIISLKEKAVFAVHSKQNPQEGEVELWASSVPAQYLLPEVLAKFHRSHPGITFRVTQADTEKVTREVAECRCELGMVGDDPGHPKCTAIPIVSESLVLIGPAGHPYAGLTVPNLARFFQEEGWVVRQSGSGTRHVAEDYLKAKGVNPSTIHPVAAFSNTQSVIHAVSSGLGVALVSEMAAADYVRRGLVSVMRLPLPLPCRSFYFLVNQEVILPPHVHVFVNFVTQYFKNEDGKRHASN